MGHNENLSIVFCVYYEVINKKATYNSKDVPILHIQPNALFFIRKTLINQKLVK